MHVYVQFLLKDTKYFGYNFSNLMHSIMELHTGNFGLFYAVLMTQEVKTH